MQKPSCCNHKSFKGQISHIGRTNVQVCIKRLYALLSLETVMAVDLDHAKEVKARLHI